MFENDVWSIPILGRAPRALTHVRRLPTAVATPQRAANVATGSRIRVRALLTSVRRSFTLIVLPASTTAVAWQVQAGICAPADVDSDGATALSGNPPAGGASLRPGTGIRVGLGIPGGYRQPHRPCPERGLPCAHAYGYPADRA